jgi:hypothetical protein
MRLVANTDAALAAAARGTAEAAGEAIGWLGDNRAKVREEAQAVARDFRKFARRARKLEAAAERPMCVAVFGPSQSGKSYLISALARRGQESVTAMFDGAALDFVRDINPEGGQEATGLVTRFTLRPPAAIPGHPVALRLLSQTDVIKILGNTFLEDFDPAEVDIPSPELVQSHCARFASRVAAEPIDRLTEDDVDDLREYFEGLFRGHPLVPGLGSAFWVQAASIGPRLPVAERAAFFSILWNGHEAFTAAARELLAALAALDFPDEAFAPLDALSPRETSIIDVRTLSALGDPSDGKLALRTRAGRQAVLPRAAVAALVAELTIALRDKPWDFFEVTDLLDFPGARSREKLTQPGRFLSEKGKLPGLFLRGKVAYLYQRYCAEQEITSMLLCIGPSNQEVRTLPRMIKDWVDGTLGATPEERARHRNALFLVLTKFDTEFEEKKGATEGTGSRWTIRLNASLLDFFGKEYDWPRNWSGGAPFANSYWLRNPNVAAKHILDYDEHGREAAPRASEVPRIARLRDEFLANDDARRHFADAARAWDAAMTLNDGGISYLAESLRPVCDPAIKRGQIAARLEALRADMAARLSPYWHSGDLTAELAKRREEARVVSRALVACASAQAFGRLIRALQVTPEELTSAWWRMQTEPAEEAPVGTRAGEEDYLAELGDLVAPAAQGEHRARDAFERYADLAVAEWMEKMHRAAAEPETAEQLKLPREAASALVAQIGAGARRTGLSARVAQRLREAASYRQKLSESAAKPVMVAEGVVNRYVHTLGYGEMPVDQRPRAGRTDRPVFAPRPPVNGAPLLGAQPEPYDKQYHVDWISAFSRLAEENVTAPGGLEIDVAQNARLGSILGALGAAA